MDQQQLGQHANIMAQEGGLRKTTLSIIATALPSTDTSSFAPSQSPSSSTIVPTLAPTLLADTDAQSHPIFRYIGVPSALLSTICSALVIYHIYASSKNRSTIGRQRGRSSSQVTFHRLLIGLCAYDILSSSTYLLEPFVTVLAPGHWTCTAGGFAKVVGVGVASYYNAGISIFSFLLIACHWKDESLKRYFEPLCHTVTLALTLVGIAGVPLRVYNPVVTDGCWAGAYPVGCEGDECSRGGAWGPVYGLLPPLGLIVAMLIMVVTHVAIFCSVRKQEQAIERYQFQSTGSSSHSAGGLGSNRTVILAPDQPPPAEQEQYRLQKKKASKARKVAFQSIFYCAGFFGCYVIALVNALATGGKPVDAVWYSVLYGIQEIMFPLQGFFNMIVYMRPKYMMWLCIMDSRWEAIKLTLSAMDVHEYKYQVASTASSRLSNHSTRLDAK